ncbi:fructose-specific PTS transporter subunit EIIC [Caldibacillus lycopersici]|uniref:Fructose-specific PTS transporter subunit EIIC n=1 Tax=Perspicuibacillus lycopersici TaxID=1325689 RepID=A0AAE3IT27_9BACI|nr:PTS fructose transporter subunit IIABC [Perspicuibacillus lycopersici]MCU9612936.1 fructose-specific PTS transporter subunit EIIC [Perspicuibacillus lycopersici]
MKITELLTRDTINIDLQSSSKADVIQELVDVLNSAGKLEDAVAYKEAILNRESQSTTGIGEGVAIPHAKTSAVKMPAIAFGRSKAGIDYEALDGQPSYLFFMIAATEGANNTHLQALAKLSMLLMKEEVRFQLMEAKTADEVITIINDHDQEDEAEQGTILEETNDGNKTNDGPLILAVTACPTGIAHTFMAAEALSDKAKEMNVNLKVETNGSEGAKNVLTEDEINRATAIIVAASKKVDMERFSGKHVIEVPVTDGIRRPQALIERAIQQDAPVYQGGKQSSSTNESQEKSSGFGFYKHLMNGVSNMLPFVVGGGLLIAISFIFGIHSADPEDPTFNEFAAALNTIGGGNAIGLMVPVLAGFIAMSIADRPGFAPGMVGGFMAAQGGAGFLGGLIAGFLAGYVVIALKRAFKNLPRSLEGIKPVLLYPLFGIGITGLIMYFVINEPVQNFNTFLIDWLNSLGTGNLVLMGLLLGGMMAIDMGGPINKAAFTFGIAMIEAGQYLPHAAIMAGGMVPPLGIAIATFLFKNKFTDKEKDAGWTNIFMGASFITEGAIPFAAADPLRVIPSAVIGSAVAGALSMFFKIGLMAPHGGVFVIAFVEGNPWLYLLAILCGAIVTALLLGILKRPISKK